MFLSRKRLEKYVLRLGLLSEVGNLTELVLKEFKCEVEGLRCKTRSSQNLDFLKKVCSENILIKSLTVQSLKMLHISKMTIIYYMYHLFFFFGCLCPIVPWKMQWKCISHRGYEYKRFLSCEAILDKRTSL